MRQQARFMQEVLSQEDAIWSLCDMPATTPTSSAMDGSGASAVAAHAKAYIVSIDMLSQDSVAFKLTSDTIEALVCLHRSTHSATANLASHGLAAHALEASVCHVATAVNAYTFCTSIRALEELGNDGRGRLQAHRSREVWNSLCRMLFAPCHLTASTANTAATAATAATQQPETGYHPASSPAVWWTGSQGIASWDATMDNCRDASAFLPSEGVISGEQQQHAAWASTEGPGVYASQLLLSPSTTLPVGDSSRGTWLDASPETCPNTLHTCSDCRTCCFQQRCD